MEGKDLTQILKDLHYDVVTGLPGSNLMGFVKSAKEKRMYYPSVSPADAAAFSLGASLAGKKCAICLYKSALTSAMSFFTSAHRAYSIPFLAIIDVKRGEMEAAHEWVTRRVEDMGLALDAKICILPDSRTESADMLAEADEFMRKTNKPVFLIIQQKFPLKPASAEVITESSPLLGVTTRSRKKEDLVRSDVIDIIRSERGNAIIVADRPSTTAEFCKDRDIPEIFTNVGNLGYDTAIGLGLAMMQDKPVIAFQGDCAALLGLTNFITSGHYAPKRFLHIVVDNGTLQNPGGLGTIGPNKDFMAIALGSGYKRIVECGCKDEIEQGMQQWKDDPEHTFMYIPVRPVDKEIYMPQTPFDTIRHKDEFIEALNK